MESIVDCNSVNPVDKDVLIRCCEEEAFNNCPRISDAIFTKIVHGIKASNGVAAWKKSIVEVCNPKIYPIV